MKQLIFSMIASSLASVSFASILKTTAPSGKSIEGVQIAKSASLTVKGQDTNLDIVGAGLRRKKVAILKVKVYVGELMASEASKFVRTTEAAVESLNLSKTIAMRMNFLYSVDGQTIKTAFVDALKANKIDMTEPGIAKTLEVVSKAGEFNSGESIVFVVQKEDNGSETLYFENPRGVVSEVNGQAGFARNFFSLWLGKTVDDQTAELKAQLIRGL